MLLHLLLYKSVNKKINFFLNKITKTFFLGKSQSNPPTFVILEGSTNSECEVKRGSIINTEIKFTATKHSKILTPTIMVLGDKISLKVPSKYIDGCKNLAPGFSCPLKRGESYLLKYKLKVPVITVLEQVKLEIAFLDDSNNEIFCFEIDCKLTGK